jgi:hypothetical protein
MTAAKSDFANGLLALLGTHCAMLLLLLLRRALW